MHNPRCSLARSKGNAKKSTNQKNGSCHVPNANFVGFRLKLVKNVSSRAHSGCLPDNVAYHRHTRCRCTKSEPNLKETTLIKVTVKQCNTCSCAPCFSALCILKIFTSKWQNKSSKVTLQNISSICLKYLRAKDLGKDVLGMHLLGRIWARMFQIQTW